MHLQWCNSDSSEEGVPVLAVGNRLILLKNAWYKRIFRLYFTWSVSTGCPLATCHLWRQGENWCYNSTLTCLSAHSIPGCHLYYQTCARYHHTLQQCTSSIQHPTSICRIRFWIPLRVLDGFCQFMEIIHAMQEDVPNLVQLKG